MVIRKSAIARPGSNRKPAFHSRTNYQTLARGTRNAMITVLGSTTLLLFVIPVLAPPVSNSTHLILEPTFVPNPKGRGTIDILFSCIITLVLCIWTAMHPDIVANKTKLGRLICKVSWMVVLLFMPQFVVSKSVHQWRDARRIHVEWCNVTGVTMGCKEDIGMEGAFFVIMGGCSLSGIGPGSIATLTPVGFLELTRNGVLPKDILTKKIINDTGKANSLTKLLFCLQSVWLAVQCAARLANSMPVTLLEYHVIIHVVYAMAMYSFWWYKPKDVSESIDVIHRSEIADHFDTYVKMESQSKGSIVDYVIKGGLGEDADILISTFIAIPYCVLHLVAWISHFPSMPELWIWRICSIGVGIAPLVLYVLLWASKHTVGYSWEPNEGDSIVRRMHNIAMAKVHAMPGSTRAIHSIRQLYPEEMIHYITMWLIFHLYLSLSILLTVVAFTSLRSVPQGTYQTLLLGDYWPHF